jgi:hypothetical protein
MSRTMRSGPSGSCLSARSIVSLLAMCFITQAWAVNPGLLKDMAERKNRGLPAMVAKEL